MTARFKAKLKDFVSVNENSIFTVEGDDVYIRFDQIQIRQTAPALVEVEYYWRGEPVYTHRVNQVDFSVGQSLMLVGIEGRMGVAITDC